MATVKKKITSATDVNTGTEIVINENALEPKDYFEVVKSKLTKLQKDKLNKQLDVLAQQIVAAKDAGQKTFLHKLAFTYVVLLKEQELLALGVEDFVYKDDIAEFIDKVVPENSVKIIELDRYPRAIPLKELKKINDIKAKNIFDDFCVVFTDFTGNNYRTEEEQKVVDRNRDPVVFGYFKNDNTGFRHDRFYPVADWQDEYCDLDFASMIERMSELGIEEPSRKISTDDVYLRELVSNVMTDMEKLSDHGLITLRDDNNKSFWKRVKTFFRA